MRQESKPIYRPLIPLVDDNNRCEQRNITPPASLLTAAVMQSWLLTLEHRSFVCRYSLDNNYYQFLFPYTINRFIRQPRCRVRALILWLHVIPLIIMNPLMLWTTSNR